VGNFVSFIATAVVAFFTLFFLFREGGTTKEADTEGHKGGEPDLTSLCKRATELQRQYNRFVQDFAHVWARELLESASKKAPGRAA
jgi:hypothetical protein